MGTPFFFLFSFRVYCLWVSSQPIPDGVLLRSWAAWDSVFYLRTQQLKLNDKQSFRSRLGATTTLENPQPITGYPRYTINVSRQRFSSTFVWCWRSMALPSQILWCEKGRFFGSLKLYEKPPKWWKGAWTHWLLTVVKMLNPWSWNFGDYLMSHLYLWWMLW